MRLPRFSLCLLVRGFLLLVGLLVIALACVYLLSQSRLDRVVPLSLQLEAPDPALVARGQQLSRSRGCADCHGQDFDGKVVIDELPFARVSAGTLRLRAGESAPAHHERMYRALHHGVDSNGRPLLMMPSAEFASLSRQEIEAIAAYLQTLPGTSRVLPQTTLGPLGRTLLVAGKLPGFLSAEVINHQLAPSEQPPPVGTLAYGRHAARLCMGCHQSDLSGGRMSHGGPGAPPAANLTPGGPMAQWTEADFVRAMRSCQRPDGSTVDGRYMPWRAVGQATDAELHAIWLYLQSLPPRQTGQR